MRFLDLNPDAMRRPSLPGQTTLGDRGENLSSVLQQICEVPERKATLLSWTQELTPMDARDFEFPSDLTGRILVTLVEGNGQRTSANSASDGTLRFLALIAAILAESDGLYFFEELENGIHPARLHLLLRLIEQRVARSRLQVIATTHSPTLLGLAQPETLETASLTYRLPGESDTRIKRVFDIPEARRVIGEQDLARLHSSGWLEDAVAFSDPDDSDR
jgi:predicted ATPase